MLHKPMHFCLSFIHYDNITIDLLFFVDFVAWQSIFHFTIVHNEGMEVD